jgi:hypothetical protein
MNLQKIPTEGWIKDQGQFLTQGYFGYRYAVLFYTMLATLLVAPIITPTEPVCSALPKRPLPRLSNSLRSSCRRQHIDRTIFGFNSELRKF